MPQKMIPRVGPPRLRQSHVALQARGGGEYDVSPLASRGYYGNKLVDVQGMCQGCWVGSMGWLVVLF